jgi:hypothetical protein
LLVDVVLRAWSRSPRAAQLPARFELSSVEFVREEKVPVPQHVFAPLPAETALRTAPSPVKHAFRERSKVEQPAHTAHSEPAETAPLERVPVPPGVAPDLSPSAAAKSWQSQTSASTPNTVAIPPRTVATAQAELNHDLSTVANELSYARRREPPRLTRRPDGNLWYQGRAFFAVIVSDGTVKFDDVILGTPAPRVHAHPPGLAPEYAAIFNRVQNLLTLQVPFPDLTDMVAHIANDDPYAGEKRWFLRETEAVRRKVSDEHRDQDRRVAKSRLLVELTGIVDNTQLSADDKRTAVFAVWELCAEDRDEPWQRVVESFVRDRMSSDSVLGYSPELLARLNRKRTSAGSFAPYRSAVVLDATSARP